MKNIKVSLDLKTKKQIFENIQIGISKKEIINKYEISESTYYNIKKSKSNFSNISSKNCNSKRIRKEKYSEINDHIIEFISRCNSDSIPISSFHLKMISKSFAEEKNITEFKCSNGWLYKLCKRNNISNVKVIGEAASSDSIGAQNYINENSIRNIFLTRRPEDIYNLDETGLFWKTLPDKSYVQKGTSVRGRKLKKERVIILLCVNFDGDKRNPLVVGK